MRPVVLPPNRFPHFSRGGAGITALRGVPAPGERAPEEWPGSTTARWGAAPSGLSALPDGRLLRDAVAADPRAWLGPGAGTEAGVLVKLLDAGERLPVHVHPTRAFTAAHLDCPTEGHLGLGFPTALGAVDGRAHTTAEVDALLRPVPPGPGLHDALPGEATAVVCRPPVG